MNMNFYKFYQLYLDKPAVNFSYFYIKQVSERKYFLLNVESTFGFYFQTFYLIFSKKEQRILICYLLISLLKIFA